MQYKSLFLVVAFLFLTVMISGCQREIPQKQIKVKVESSEPIYKSIVHQKPRQICYEKEIEEEVSCGGERERNSVGLDTIIGATAGVVLGNRFKNHSDAAKVIGGVAGAVIANNMRKNVGICYENRVKNICETEYDEVNEEVLEGYRNCGHVNGEKVCKKHKRKLSSFTVGLNY